MSERQTDIALWAVWSVGLLLVVLLIVALKGDADCRLTCAEAGYGMGSCVFGACICDPSTPAMVMP